MAYYLDLKSISLDAYKEKLKKAYLPPSRSMLRERLEERFAVFQQTGLQNLKELQDCLRNKKNKDKLAAIECLSGDYLLILLRELNSMLPKPNKIRDFSGLAAHIIEKLENAGIKDTFKLFEKVKTISSRNTFADALGISHQEILELTKLTDLSRIKWTGVTFARVLYDLGIDTVERAANANPEELHARINQVNKEKAIFKGHIGLNDIRVFVEAASEVPLEIEY